jgi:hypothetical protein
MNRRPMALLVGRRAPPLELLEPCPTALEPLGPALQVLTVAVEGTPARLSTVDWTHDRPLHVPIRRQPMALAARRRA